MIQHDKLVLRCDKNNDNNFSLVRLFISDIYSQYFRILWNLKHATPWWKWLVLPKAIGLKRDIFYIVVYKIFFLLFFLNLRNSVERKFWYYFTNVKNWIHYSEPWLTLILFIVFILLFDRYQQDFHWNHNPHFFQPMVLICSLLRIVHRSWKTRFVRLITFSFWFEQIWFDYFLDSFYKR